MRTAVKLVTMMSGGVLTYAQVIDSIAPDMLWSMRATSGVNEINRGSAGASYDAAIGGGITLGQTGQLGENNAHDIDGLTGYYQVPTGAALQGGKFWWGFLINPDNAGELNAARLFNYATTGNQFLRFNSAAMILRATLPASVTNPDTITSTVVPSGQWSWIFEAYDDTGLILGDRKIHLYLGDIAAGTVTEMAYTTNIAASGTFTVPSVGDLFLANINTGAAVTFDGKYDEVIRKGSFPATLSLLLAQWTQLVIASHP